MNNGASTWPTKMLAAVDSPTADLKCALERPGKSAHDRRHDAPVEQQRGQHAHQQDHGQRLEGEAEFRSRGLELERQRAAADIAEHERRAGPGRCRDLLDRAIDPGEGNLDFRHLEQKERQQKGDCQADAGLPPVHRAAVLADDEGDGDDRDHPGNRLQIFHDVRSPIPRVR
jgi:hypothetical protein